MGVAYKADVSLPHYVKGTMNRDRVLKVVLVVVGLIFSALVLSLDDVCAARACVGTDA
jgi:hypothetical protein